MKVVSIVGARPQFIKAAPVSKALREAGHQEILVHTGQHYDYGMSQVFFEELDIPAPSVNLEVGSASHGLQTGQMLIGIERVLTTEKPDWMLIYGDTNSTLAGALAACKLRIPLAHVEAGLRSFNREMPEEHNRVLADHCADILFCPTQTAADNLSREGISKGVHTVGDTMYDAVLQFAAIAERRSTILQKLNLSSKEYLLLTAHRAYNTDVPENLHRIFSAMIEIGEPIIFPVHPRTQRCLAELEGKIQFNNSSTKNIRMIEPVGYLDMLVLEKNARLVLTDSGGMQKEAYFFGVPCLTLRPETEWVETVEAGWNVVTNTDPQKIIHTAQKHEWPKSQPPRVFGEGDAAFRIMKILAGERL